MSIIRNNKGDIGVLFAILFLIVLIVIIVAVDATILSKIEPKFNGTDASSNATMSLAKERGWNAVDLSGIGLPVIAAFGFVIFIILWQRQPDGGQP